MVWQGLVVFGVSTYSEELNAVFIHVPKTAGTSIERVLFPLTGGHEGIRQYEHIDGAFKFAFVRNPFDRFVSCYFAQNATIKSKKGFIEYILNECSEGEYPTKSVYSKHFKPMYSFLINNDYQIGVDFVGSYENLQRDWEYVCDKLNVSHELPHFRKTQHRYYKYYYIPETWDIIGKLYSMDIDMFEYGYDTFEKVHEHFMHSSYNT
jgi:hypothetical protein